MVLEHEDRAWQWAAGELLRQAGYEVTVCGGPHQLPKGRCPLVEDDRCPIVDDADVVVNGFTLSDPENRNVVVSLRTQRNHTPVIVEVPDPELDDLNTTIPGCRTVRFPVLPKELLAAVDKAITDTAIEGPADD